MFLPMVYENNLLKIKMTRNAKNRLRKHKDVWYLPIVTTVTVSNMMILFT